MYNKKVLSTAKKELTKAKAPKKPKDIITDPMGQWKYPGLPTRIPSNDITMKGVGYPVLGVANNGQRKIMLPGADYTFPGADYVDEYPQMRKGGAKKKKTKSLSGTNKLMLTHPLLQNYKNKVYDPNVNYFQKGGIKGNWKVREELYDGEDAYFKANPHVGGMAAEDDTIILNPYSKLSKAEKEAIIQNEKARLTMRNGYARPNFDLTEEQAKAFENYSPDIQDQRETVVGRILSGDPSQGNITKQQKQYAEELKRFMDMHKDTVLTNTSGPRNFQKGGMKTVKSKDGTVTNRFINEAGDEVVQVKTKDGKYTEKVIPAIQQYKALRDIEKIVKVPFHPETEEEYDKLPADEKLRRFERTVDVNLGYPQKRAAQVAQDVTEPGNDPVDNIRHPFAGRYTAEAAYNSRKKNAPWAPDWLNKAGAWVDANALGVGHEATTLFKDKRPWGTKLRESAEDIYNNAVGVNVGLSDKSEREKDMILINKSKYNKIPDGFGEEHPFQLTNPKWTDPYDKKQDGGYIEAELTDDEIEEYRKGGYIVEDISVPELNQAQKGKFIAPPLPRDRTRSETTQRVSLPSRQAVLHVKNKPAADKALKKEKKEQQKFKEELWKKYKKLPLSEKISDRVGAFINDPLGMTSRALLGEQAYIPGMAQGLHDYENPEVREKYLKELGYTPGEFDASDIQNMINPGNWVTSITENSRKGNIGTAALEGALMFLPHLPKGTISRSNIKSGTKLLADDIVDKTPLKNTYKILGKDTKFHNPGEKPHWFKGYTESWNPMEADLEPLADFRLNEAIKNLENKKIFKEHDAVNDKFSQILKDLINEKQIALKANDEKAVSEINAKLDDVFNARLKEHNKIAKKHFQSKQHPFEERIGAGGFGTVYGLPESEYVIKVGQIPKNESILKLVENAKGINKPNIALPKRASTTSSGENVIVMNKVEPVEGNMFTTPPTKESYEQLIKDVEELQGKGIYLDFENPQNIQYNPKTGLFNIYDLNTTGHVLHKTLPKNSYKASEKTIEQLLIDNKKLPLDWNKKVSKQLSTLPNLNEEEIVKAGLDGNFLTRPLTLFTKNEMLGTPDKKMLYRKIGNAKGLQDLIEKQGAQAPKPMTMTSGATIDTPFFGAGTKPNENYGGLFAVEVDPSNPKYSWSNNVGGVSNYGVAPYNPETGELIKNIPLEDLNVYKKKWFSNNYKKLKPEELEAALMFAREQALIENAYKWGVRGTAADQIFNDGDYAKAIQNYFLGKPDTSRKKREETNDNYEKGGIVADLTPEEIQDYIAQGYTIEEVDEPELIEAQKGISKSQKKSWESLGKQLKKPVIKIPKNAAEAQKMMDSGELDYESWEETKARNIKEAEDRKQARLKSLKDYEKRVSNKKYNSLTGLPNEDWRELLANEAAPLGAKFRVSQEDNFFDDYLNPLAMIGSGAQSLGEAPKLAKESDSYIPYVSAIGSPLLTGALAGVGANNTKQFLNNLFNPLADAVSISDIAKSGVKKIKDARQARKLKRVLKNLTPIDYDNLVPARSSGINRQEWATFVDGVDEPILTEATTQAPQLRPITDFTSNSLMRSDAIEDIANQWMQANNIDRIRHLNDSYDRAQDLFNNYNIDTIDDVASQIENLPNETFERFRNDMFNLIQDVSPSSYNNVSYENMDVVDDVLDNTRNKSYFSRKKILEKAKNSEKLKEQLDQLTPEQFEQTVYKPTNELVEYVPVDKLNKLKYVPDADWTGKMIHKDAIPLSKEEYSELFNNNIDKLNEIIENYNTSGLSYNVSELRPDGTIRFTNPKQYYKKTPTTKQLESINKLQDEINNINESLEKGLYNSESDITQMLSKKDYAEKRLKRFEKALRDEEIPQGTSSFHLDIIPGQWRGEVEDIANSDYYKYLPGLNMSATTGSVFSDRVPRRGTGFYEALNEYLKKYDLGRVKPGFNSQTEYSEGLWNNAILKGKAHGFYGGTDVLHGSFKKNGGIILELSDAEINEYKKGGYIVEELDNPEMQVGGQMPYQIWEEKTGTPWSEAKRQGLTDGSYKQNVALAQKLLADATSVIKENLESKPTYDYNKYDQIVSTLVQKGNTLEDLVAQQIGTKEGLMKRYPKLFSASNSKSKAVNTANIPVKNVDEILKKPTAPINLKVPQTKMKSETLQYQNVPFKKLNLISDSNLKPKPVSSTVKQFERSKKVNETKLKEAEFKNYVNTIRESLTPDSVKKQKQLQNSFFPTAPKKKLTVREPLTQETTQEFRDRMMKIQQGLNLKPIQTDTEKIVPIKNFQDLQGVPGKNNSTVNLPEVNGKEFPVKKPVVKVKPLQDITKIQNSFKPEMSFKKGSKLTEAKPETEEQVVKEDSGYKVISNLTNRISSYDQSLQNLYYDYTNPKHSPEKRKQVKAAFDNKLKERNNLITTINSKKRDYAGVLDSWIDESAPAWIKKPAQKGIFNVSLADQVEASSYKLPKFETYKEKEEKENEKFRTSKRFDDLGGNEKGSRWQFRVAASNDDPMKVQLYGTRSERNPNLNIKAKGAVMHFLDQSPLTGYVHPTTQAYYRDLKPDGFVGKLEKQKDGNYAVKYIPKKDIPAKDLYKNTFLVRQEKFDNIDFNTKVSDRNFLGHTYWTKKGSTKATIPISSGKDANVYDYASGQSVVFIFPYKGKTRYIHFAGSPNAIKKEGEEIKKLYKLQANKLVLGLADAGSYSSSIKGNITDKKLKDWSYGYANTNGFTGAGMALVD